jgi:hypothetical protein
MELVYIQIIPAGSYILHLFVDRFLFFTFVWNMQNISEAVVIND